MPRLRGLPDVADAGSAHDHRRAGAAGSRRTLRVIHEEGHVRRLGEGKLRVEGTKPLERRALPDEHLVEEGELAAQEAPPPLRDLRGRLGQADDSLAHAPRYANGMEQRLEADGVRGGSAAEQVAAVEEDDVRPLD